MNSRKAPAPRPAPGSPDGQRRRLTAALLAGPLALSATAVPGLGRAADALPKVIRIASPDLSAGPKPYAGPSTVSLAHIRRAIEKEFEPDGVQVEWSFFKGAGPAVNEAFANRQIDFAFLGDLAAIIGRAGGLPTRFLLSNRGSNTYLGVPLDSGITRLEDLKGKRVALFRGTADQLAFGRSLALAGLAERDLQIVNLDWTAARAALTAGQVDAAWQGLGLLALQERGQIKVPASTKQFSDRQVTTQSGLVAAQAFLDAHPQAAQRVVNALVKQAHWASQPEHLDALIATFSEQGSLPPSLLRGEFEGENPQFRYSPRLDPFIAKSYTDSVAEARSLGLIRRDFDAQAWLAPEFVEKALAAQGLQSYWPRYDAAGQPIAAG